MNTLNFILPIVLSSVYTLGLPLLGGGQNSAFKASNETKPASAAISKEKATASNTKLNPATESKTENPKSPVELVAKVSGNNKATTVSSKENNQIKEEKHRKDDNESKKHSRNSAYRHMYYKDYDISEVEYSQNGYDSYEDEEYRDMRSKWNPKAKGYPQEYETANYGKGERSKYNEYEYGSNDYRSKGYGYQDEYENKGQKYGRYNAVTYSKYDTENQDIYENKAFGRVNEDSDSENCVFESCAKDVDYPKSAYRYSEF